MDIFDLAAKITLDSKDYEKGVESAESKFSGLGDKIKSGLATIGKVTAAGLSAAATSVSAIVKSAVDEYASYEQLVGGVETLFGAGSASIEEYAAQHKKSVSEIKSEYEKLMKSQQQVMDNAAIAYRTAGLSANEYMETITSFSASLLQSLGGDTVKAAEAGNMAVIDMADNANKMGTDIQSIQNAYQGFAKKNYTMLDNLKLGYGGTQEEMSRLIEDASAMTDVQKKLGVTVDKTSSSFANIVNAIHVIQTSMGITGTTAKEAASTIQGSVASMGASWHNLLVGVSDDTQDFGLLVDEFVNSVATAAGNILPRIETSLAGVGKLIDKLVPIIVEKIPEIAEKVLPSLISAASSLLDGLAKSLPSLITILSKEISNILPELLDVVSYLAESFVTMLPQIVQLGLDLIISLANGIAESLPELIPTIIDVVLQIVDTLTDPETLSQLLDAALTLILALAEGLLSEDSINAIIDSIFLLVDNIITFLTDPENIMKLVDAAVRLVVAIAEGLISAVGRIQEKADELIDKFKTKFEETDWLQLGKDIINSVKDGIVSIAKKAGTWGKDLIDNFIGGIKEKWENLKNTVSNVAQSVKDFLGFSEPKKGPLSNFHTYAPDMMDLFAKGIRDNEDVITDQIEKSFNFGYRTIKFGAEYGNAYGVAKSGGMAYGGSTIETVNININGANVHNDSALADMIAERLQMMTERRGAVFA